MSWNLLFHHVVPLFFLSPTTGPVFSAFEKIQCPLIFYDKGNISIALLLCQKASGEKENSVRTGAALEKKKITQAVCRCILNVNEWMFFVSRLPYNRCCYANWQLQGREKPFLALITQVFMWVHMEEKGCFASTQIFSKSKRRFQFKKVKKQ